MKMTFKKLFSAFMCAAVIGASAVPAYAELQTSVVMNDMNASVSEWDGKTKLKEGKEYVVSKNITVSKKITIPKGAKVTVKNGAKLWVSSKGKLYVKGTLRIDKGATLAVTGTLYEYGSKTIANYGTISFSSKSNVTLNGKFYNKSTGVVKGEPKKLSVGSKATLSDAGKISSKKLTKVLIADMIDDMYTYAMVKDDMYSAVKSVLPEGMLKNIEKVYAEENNTSFEDFCKEFGKVFADEIKAEYGLSPDSVDVVVTKVTDITPDEQQKGTLDNFYKGYRRFVSVTAEVSLVENDQVVSEKIQLNAVLLGTRWYQL